jgi:hypothetical protein
MTLVMTSYGPLTLRRVVFGVGLRLDVTTVVATRVGGPGPEHLIPETDTQNPRRKKSRPLRAADGKPRT